MFAIRLPSFARKLFKSNDVQLLWDREERRAAIQATTMAGGSINYRLSKSGGITCCPFLKATGLRGAGKLLVFWDSENQRLWWNIPEPEPEPKPKPKDVAG
jgi:hypothetical protein